MDQLQVLLELSKTVENKGSSVNCPAKVWRREPVSGFSGAHPVPEGPEHTVNEAIDSRDVKLLNLEVLG